MRRALFPWALALAVALPACFARALLSPLRPPAPAPMALPKTLAREDARLAVSWIGHATVLVQMDDKMILTDPVLTETVGLLSRRLVALPMDPADMPPLDAVLVSHMHFDHLSLGSLAKIEDKVHRLYVPEGGLVYLTDFRFDAIDLARWETVSEGGLTITAVPVKHNGMRYGIDNPWMHAYTGYVVRYHGMTVYFGGDTAYDRDAFAETRRRFPSIDLALLPIAPIHPRSLMAPSHMEPNEAILAMEDLGAARMVPIHFDTFLTGTDERTEERDALVRAKQTHELTDERVALMAIGEQRTFVPR